MTIQNGQFKFPVKISLTKKIKTQTRKRKKS